MNRFFYSDNGSLTDYSPQMKNYRSGSVTFNYVKDEDAIYIGHELPFNSFYLKSTVVNTNASVMSIYYWDSVSWKQAIEVIDETSVGGKSLAQDGYITFVPDKNYSWVKESTYYNGESIDELTDIRVYDHYWIKIVFSNNLSSGVTLSWFGQKFCNDYDLASEYPDLVRTSLMDIWESGKTSWEEQEIIASEMAAKFLISKKLISDKAQILDRDELTRVIVPLVASIIHNGMGKDYETIAKTSRDEYINRISNWYPRHIDFFNQGRVDYNAHVSYGKLMR